MLYTVETSRESSSDNISRDNEGFTVSCWLLYFSFELLGRIPSKFHPSEQFCYTFIPNNFKLLRKHIFLDVKVNTLQFWSHDGIEIFTIGI